jgi:ketosteroid isomerase-like protein
MSRENVEVVRSLYAAGNRRDADAVLSYLGRDAALDASEAGLGSFEGAIAIRGFFDDWWRSYEEYENVPEEVISVSQGVVLVVNTLKGRLPGTDEPLHLHNAYMFRFEDGLIVRWAVYQKIDDARRAAFLRVNGTARSSGTAQRRSPAESGGDWARGGPEALVAD